MVVVAIDVVAEDAEDEGVGGGEVVGLEVHFCAVACRQDDEVVGRLEAVGGAEVLKAGFCELFAEFKVRQFVVDSHHADVHVPVLLMSIGKKCFIGQLQESDKQKKNKWGRGGNKRPLPSRREEAGRVRGLGSRRLQQRSIHQALLGCRASSTHRPCSGRREGRGFGSTCAPPRGR